MKAKEEELVVVELGLYNHNEEFNFINHRWEVVECFYLTQFVLRQETLVHICEILSQKGGEEDFDGP